MHTVARTATRQQIDQLGRIVLLEDDADQLEVRVTDLSTRIDKRLDKIMAVCLTILASVTTAAILLALNLVVK